MKSSAKSPNLTIVIPALSEEKRIGKSLNSLASFLKEDKFFKDKSVEVIVVCADSSDKTSQIVEKQSHLFQSIVLIRPGPKVGKGRDVQAGMLQARGQAVIFMDADLSTPLSHIKEFYEEFERGNEVVIATRSLFQYRGTLLRSVSSIIGNLIFRLGSGLQIEDSQCGFKLFSNAASEVCFSKLKVMGWGFDMEILSIAKAYNFRIKTIRINDWRHTPGGPFEQKILKNCFDSLGELASVFSRRISGKYRIREISGPVGEDS